MKNNRISSRPHALPRYGLNDYAASEYVGLTRGQMNRMVAALRGPASPSAGAKRRLADEYDAAQERGEVAAHGGARNFNIPSENIETTVGNLGLTSKDIHEARILRDAEAADPGITRRTLDERIGRGEEPSKAAATRGAKEAG